MWRSALKILGTILLIITAVVFYYYGYPSDKSDHYFSESNKENENTQIVKLQEVAKKARSYCKARGYNNDVCLLVDMSMPSGKNRLFEYDLKHDSILSIGLVAHGSCNDNFLANPKFSNEPGCGCTSLGKYKIGYKYKGKFGNAYKLYGLDSSNNNSFKRNIILHSYYMVPDKETYPAPICNSLGCAMVSTTYIKTLAKHIDASDKPMLLWIFE
ncbi:murein L,D-transpeptidase catalytic domain family protein [soil metagenome]